jgi:hypothetical protein
MDMDLATALLNDLKFSHCYFSVSKHVIFGSYPNWSNHATTTESHLEALIFPPKLSTF